MNPVACILASSKPWHREHCELSVSLPQVNWIWVDSPHALDRALAQQPQVRYVFFLHWHWLVADHIWQNHECVCFHMTDVPYGRGGSPLQNLIIRGHTETQLTALRMERELDAGPVYAKRPLSLAGSAEEIYQRSALQCFEMIAWMLENCPQPQPQQGTPVLFSRRTPDQSRLPAAGSLSGVYDFIRMLDAPTYPRAFIEHGEFTFELSEAALEDGEVVARVRIRKLNDQETP